MPQSTHGPSPHAAGARQQSAGQTPKSGRGQQTQTIPKKDLPGPGGDPAEGKREVRPKPR